MSDSRWAECRIPERLRRATLCTGRERNGRLPRSGDRFSRFSFAMNALVWRDKRITADQLEHRAIAISVVLFSASR